MLSELRTKIRALVSDFTKSDIEVFEYTISKIFTLAESNIIEITKVLHNGVSLGTAQYSYDSITNKIEILVPLTSRDLIETNYTFSKYSSTELDEYIKAALVWLSVFGCSKAHYEIENGDIFPTPNSRIISLIALIASIIIKPNWSQYSLPNIKVVYPRNLSKEEKIERLVLRFTSGLGVSGVLKIN